jgi:hypothetical protein
MERQKPQPDGSTLAEAFESFRRQTGKRHPQDKPSEIKCPEHVMYLYRWFMELAHGRPVGGMGVMMPIPSSEILAWSQLSGNRLEDWEITTIRALDAAYLRIMSEKT